MAAAPNLLLDDPPSAPKDAPAAAPPSTYARQCRFKYEGPVAATDERSCYICAAVATGKNHKTSIAMGPDRSSCPVEHVVRRKAAGKSVHCPNHGGLAAALDAHLDEHPDQDPEMFASLRCALDGMASTAHAAGKAFMVEAYPHALVHVEMSAHADPRKPDGSPDTDLPPFDCHLLVRAPAA